MTKNTEYNIYIHKIGILFGIVFFINIVSHFINKGILKENKFLAEASFFVFAMHEPYLTLIRKLLFKLTRPSSDVGIILLYIICPLTIIGITLSTYYIIKKNIPQVLIILTGRTMENKSIVTKFSQSKVS